MPGKDRPAAFWIFVVFFALSIVLLLMGQTISVFNYDLTVRFGLQESPEQVSTFGVQVNRALGAADTVVYIPLLIVSLVGLWMKKRWSLLTTAAAVGVSAYWSINVSFLFLFLPGTSGYSHRPGPEIWSFVGAYIVFGVWGILYLIFRGEKLLK